MAESLPNSVSIAGSPWGDLASWLDRIESNGEWSNDATSFSEWLRLNAMKSGNSESTFWRYLGSGRYYRELAIKLKSRGIKAPPLGEASSTVSAESLEILAKISRAAPEKVFLDTAVKLLDGSMTRAVLRRTWSAYRPALEGKTARGSRGMSPKVDITAPESMERVLFATVTASLARNVALLSEDGDDAPTLFETNVATDPGSSGRGFVTMDAVAAFREAHGGKLVLHCIESVGGRESSPAKKLEKLAPFCDRIWVAGHKGHLNVGADIPSFVGVLAVDDAGTLRVKRRAKASGTLGRRSGELARGLLLRKPV